MHVDPVDDRELTARVQQHLTVWRTLQRPFCWPPTSHGAINETPMLQRRNAARRFHADDGKPVIICSLRIRQTYPSTTQL
jgi:hypothetical protein